MNIKAPRSVGDSFEQYCRYQVQANPSVWKEQHRPDFFTTGFDKAENNPRDMQQWMLSIRKTIGETFYAMLRQAWAAPPSWFEDMKGKWGSYNPKWVGDAPREIQNS